MCDWAAFFSVKYGLILIIKTRSIMRLEYLDNGKISGLAVVFLHGWDQSAHTFDAFLNAIDARCIALQFGDVDTFYDVYTYALDVYMTLKAIGVDRVILVGHSFGGRIATILAALFDLDVAGLVLIDSAGIRPKHGLKYKLSVLKYKYLSRHNLVDKIALNDYTTLPISMRSVFIRVVNEDLRYLLPRIHANTRIFWGMEDESTPLRDGQIFHKMIAGSKLDTFHGGHFAFLSHKYMIIDAIGSLLEFGKIDGTNLPPNGREILSSNQEVGQL